MFILLPWMCAFLCTKRVIASRRALRKREEAGKNIDRLWVLYQEEKNLLGKRLTFSSRGSNEIYGPGTHDA